MKYILMIIMFISSLGICMLVNRSKKDRIAVLTEIKQSTKAFDINQYFSAVDTAKNAYFPKLKCFVDNVAQKRSKITDTKDEIFKNMNQIFFEKSDSSMLNRWLSLIKHPDNSTKRDEVEKQCTQLIEKTQREETSNIYIAVALGIVLIIILL